MAIGVTDENRRTGDLPLYTLRNKATGEPKINWHCFGPGPFRPAALLVAEAARGLCRAESAAGGSVYSTVDSVTLLDDREPRVWREWGIQ